MICTNFGLKKIGRVKGAREKKIYLATVFYVSEIVGLQWAVVWLWI